RQRSRQIPAALLPEGGPPVLLHAAQLGLEGRGGGGERPRSRGTVARAQPPARQTGAVGGAEEGLDGGEAERADVARARGWPGTAAGRGARRPDDGGDEQCGREPESAELDASVWDGTSLGDGMTGEEGHQAVRHVARILEMEEMPCAGENERLDIRQPLEQQRVPLMKAGIALFPDDGEHRLPHAPRLFRPEGPLLQGR